MYRVVCLLVFVSGAWGQLVVDGHCNFANIGGFVTDLNVTRVLGTWNQIARIDNEVEIGDCSTMTLTGVYSNSEDLLTLLVSVVDVSNKTKTVRNGTIEALAVDGLFLFNIPDFFVGQFVVQSTNYTDYAILYSCYQLTETTATQNATKVVLAWQYHKKTELSSAEETSIQAIVNENPDLRGVNWRYISHNKTACGNGAVSLTIPHVLFILATLVIGKEII